jgi:hypothetical protein
MWWNDSARNLTEAPGARLPDSLNCEDSIFVRSAPRALVKPLRYCKGWKIIDRVPRIRLLRGEQPRQFVLSHELEPLYLNTIPPLLHEIAVVLLDTGIRLGEPTLGLAARSFLATAP